MQLLNGFYQSITKPEQGLFQTQGFEPNFEIKGSDRLASIPMASLAPFLRVLLVTDGTVTKSLEAFFGEPIAVDLVEQADVSLPFQVPYLSLAKADSVLARHIQLRGEHSNKVYACAFSLINPSAIQTEMLADLRLGKIGIGAIIRAKGLMSYREIIDISHCQMSSHYFTQNQASVLALRRSYGIVMQQQSAILVTEYFNHALLNQS